MVVKDFNSLSFDGEYDLIFFIVVMMFFEFDIILGLIVNMQCCIVVGGYNLIVVVMDIEDYFCIVGFLFVFKFDEFCDYYQGWELLKYNEDVGELYCIDVNGNCIKLCFVILLVCKFV